VRQQPRRVPLRLAPRAESVPNRGSAGVLLVPPLSLGNSAKWLS